MPEPRWISTEYDPTLPAQTDAEVLGRGEASRRSKTFLQDKEQAHITAKIAHHIRTLKETFRRLHAKHYHRRTEVKAENGEFRVENVPDVLSDEELIREYPVIAMWMEYHSQAIGHYTSIEGFSIKSTFGEHRKPPEVNENRRDQESSAGASQERRKRWE